MAAILHHVPPKGRKFPEKQRKGRQSLLGAERVTTELEGRAVHGARVKRSSSGICLAASKLNVFCIFIELLLVMLSNNTFQTVLNEKRERGLSGREEEQGGDSGGASV